MRPVVVDASVLIAALMADGTARRVLVHAPCSFYVPPRILEETNKHLPKIAKRAGLPQQSIKAVIEDLFTRIEVVPPALIAPFLAEATKRTKKADALGDEHYVALALALDAPLWTYDDDFGRISGIRTISTTEVANPEPPR